MAEKTKEEELKQKLLDFFDKKLTDLTTKFEADIDSIEKMKFEYFDNVIKKYQEIEEEHKKEEEKEKEKPEKEKEKPEKKSEEPKHEKVTKKKLEKIDPTLRPKTPMANTKKREGKEDKAHDTTTDKHKKDAKEDKGHDTTDKHKKDAKAKPATHAPAGGKAPAGKKGDKKPMIPKSKTTINKKGGTLKGGKKDAKKETKEKKEEEKKEEEHVEEKKQIILNPKYKYQVSDELKKNSGLSCLYFILKGGYLDKKNTLHISTNSPLLYKSMGSNMKYLLDDKKKEVQAKADEIQNFLNNYGDLNTYLTKEFTLSKKVELQKVVKKMLKKKLRRKRKKKRKKKSTLKKKNK
jgi:hypothetical protein